MAVDAIRVIGAAMADAGVVGIGCLTMSRRARMVMVDPRGTGVVLNTLRAADEVRMPQFAESDGAIDAEMLAIARAIIEQRAVADPCRIIADLQLEPDKRTAECGEGLVRAAMTGRGE